MSKLTNLIIPLLEDNFNSKFWLNKIYIVFNISLLFLTSYIPMCALVYTISYPIVNRADHSYEVKTSATEPNPITI